MKCPPSSRSKRFAARALVALVTSLAAPALLAQTTTAAGTPSSPSPTLEHLTLEWPIAGDDDLDGRVAVRFRAVGAAAWRQGMPLRRIPGGGNSSVGATWSNRHSGSLFGLDAGTTYEIELTLADPDGGSTQRTLTATTRTMPVPMANAPVKPATPATLATVLGSANPGDIVELGAGTYAGFQVNRDGTAGKPIVVRGTPGAVVTGEIGLFGRAHVMLRSLEVVGRIRFNGSNHVSIVGCRVTASGFNGDTIVTFTRAENAYIADNVVTGLTTWAESSLGASGNNQGEGIVVTGPGHVIARNRVRGFRDGISLMEGIGAGGAVDQHSIDIVDNEISEAADDGIEADFCFHNCRVVRNRLTNTFIAMSSQPSLGGPTYFVRNAAYNVVHLPFKLYRGSVGDVVLHNTVVKHGDALNLFPGTPISHAYFRNNLLIGGPAGTFNGYASGSGRVIDATAFDATSSLDHDGYGTTLPGFEGRLGPASFTSVDQLRAVTTEAHARRVGLEAFTHGIAFPSSPLTAYAAPNLAVLATSAAADAGEPIPNINDGYAGTAPDLGAYEAAAAGGGAVEAPLFSNGYE